MAKSLVSSRVESNSGVGLPVGFRQAESNIVVGDPLFQSTAYVLFVSQKGDSFAKLLPKLPGLQDGDPVLVPGGVNPPVILNPFKFYLIAAWQHFSVVTTTGEIVKSTLNPVHVKRNPGSQWNEHIETVLVVDAGKELGLIPARCTFKTTKCRAAFKAIQTNQQAQDPSLWEKLSPEHKESLVATEAWARFVTTVTLKRMTSKSSGLAYTAADAFCTPTTLADWKRLGHFFQDEKNKAMCDAVMEQHGKRVKQISTKLEGGE